MTTKVRGCGTRVQGGVYIETTSDPFGQPVEFFLIDPPRPIVPDEIGLTPIGVTPVVRDGVTHVMDWVGSESYPNVADFIEEAKRMGVSRRLSKAFEFETLSPESRLILVHAKAFIEWPRKLWEEIVGIEGNTQHVCPKDLPDHPDAALEMTCLGLCWFDLPLPEDGDAETSNRYDVEMPWGSYVGTHVPGTRKHQPAVFASFPIGQVTVVRDPDGGSHEEALEKASKVAGLPVVLEDA